MSNIERIEKALEEAGPMPANYTGRIVDKKFFVAIVAELETMASAANAWGENEINEDTLLKNLEFAVRNLRQIIKGE